MSVGPPAAPHAVGLIARVARDTTVACFVLAASLWLWRSSEPRLALGVLGGGVLIGVSMWAIAGAVAQVTTVGSDSQVSRATRLLPLVKFFTRHVILALVAYGMLVRLQLHPVGIFIGVSTVVLAAAAEAFRATRSAR